MFITMRDWCILFPSKDRNRGLQNSRIERVVDPASDQSHRGLGVDDEVEERLDNRKWHWPGPLE